MKLLLILSLIVTAAALTSCSESSASPSTEHTTAPENGAQFKEGKGVALTALMAESIRLQTAEVAEEKITPAFTVSLQAMQRGTCLLYTSPSPRDVEESRMPSSA